MTKKDIFIHTVSSGVAFGLALFIGLISDLFLHLSGVQLVIVSSIITFSARYLMLKWMGFGK